MPLLGRKRRRSTPYGRYGKRRAYARRPRSASSRGYRRRRRSRRRRSILPATFPTKIMRTFKWHTMVQIGTGAAGASGIWNFRMNSIYDPDATLTTSVTGTSTVGNTQPQWHDAWMAIYSRYKVHSFGYKVTFFSAEGSKLARCAVAWQAAIGGVGSASDDLDAMIADRRCKVKILSSRDNARSLCSFKGKLNLRRVEGRPLDHTYEGTVSGNPTNIPYLTLYTQAIESSDQPSDLYADVTLYYDTVLSERVQKVIQD